MGTTNRPLRVCYREGKSKGAALPNHAFNADAAPVRLYDMASNSQAQSAATSARTGGVHFRTRAVYFVKSFEDARQVLCRNANTRIAHKENLRLPSGLQLRAGDNHSLRWSKFDGVMYKIDKHTYYLLAVRGNSCLPILYLAAQGYTIALRLRYHARHHLAHQQFGFDGFNEHWHLARFDTREFKQFRYQVCQMFDLVFDALDKDLCLLRVSFDDIFQRLRQQANGGQRGAQFMRDIGDEIAPHSFQAAQFG